MPREGAQIHKLYDTGPVAPANAVALDAGGGGNHTGGMEARVAVLEQIAKTTSEALTEIRADLRALRDKQESDFRISFGALITVALGLAALMAKGFHWF